MAFRTLSNLSLINLKYVLMTCLSEFQTKCEYLHGATGSERKCVRYREGKLLQWRPIRRSRLRWEDNIKLDLEEKELRV
jgi:hypothetical protein